MAKKNRKKKNGAFAIGENTKALQITSASIKDDFCNYSFDILTGTGVGDTHNVKGKGIIDPDMHEALRKFNVHLAIIDDAFVNSGIDVKQVEPLENHELTDRYIVTGFKIKGSQENESIILMGSKYVSQAGGRIELETPKIPLDSLSSYKWYNELKEAADAARNEVELYKEGKCTMVEEEYTDPAQLTIAAQLEDQDNENNPDSEITDVEFEDAKV